MRYNSFIIFVMFLILMSFIFPTRDFARANTNHVDGWKQHTIINNSLEKSENSPMDLSNESSEKGLFPYNIVTTVYGDPTSEIAFTWHTKNKGNSDIQYIAKTTDSPDFSTPLENVGDIKKNVEEIGGYSHQVHLKNLIPGTTYWYRVGDKSTDTWSEIATFTTTQKQNKTSFLYITDSQGSKESDYEISSNTVKQGVQSLKNVDFILQTGDLVNHSKSPDEWFWLFNSGKYEFMNYAWSAVPGNHDAWSYTFSQHFYYNYPSVAKDFLKKGVYYSFDHGPAHFVALNTNDQSRRPLNSTQINWLKQDLSNARANGAKWLVVFFHKGIFTGGAHADSEEIDVLRKQLAPIFESYQVDVILQGHDHSYFRSKIMNGLSPSQNIKITNEDGRETIFDPKGQSYHVINTTGTKFYDAKSQNTLNRLGVYPEKVAQPYKQMFAGVTITEDRFCFDAYSYDAKSVPSDVEIFDAYSIVKSDRAIQLRNEIEHTLATQSLIKEEKILNLMNQYRTLDPAIQSYVTNYSELEKEVRLLKSNGLVSDNKKN
ncbi:hypothetical protein BM86_14715 [Bacillus thuringiensis]|uniref:Uncharacterized protein n=1 Tax=Bacillus thuringiensis TaxID=1428 RepID=A0A9W3SJU9_BACTU|nr:metallophosphoesterase family protein [Bacillus thuringiensis]ANS52387.1 hypothetical protein BT246_70970 [Bacillus thuringiensis]MBH0336697.1 hypothetical protein [Bacillus thuringiensis]